MLAKFDEIHQPVPTESTLKNSLYSNRNNNNNSNHNSSANRPVPHNNSSSSPISNNPLRTAHPGAVLLSPQSSSLNIIDTNNASAMSPTMPSSASSSIFFNDFMSLDAAKGASANSNRPMTAIPLSSTANSQGSAYTFAFQNNNSNNSNNTSKASAGSALGNMHNNSVTAGSVSNNNNNIFMDSFLSNNNNAQSSTNSNVNTALNFNNDINQLCTWMSMLNVNQQSVVMDNILSILNESTLNYTKMKLDSMFGSTTSSSPTIPDPSQNGNHANGHHGLQNSNNNNNNSNNNNNNTTTNSIASPVPNSIDSVFASNSMKFLQSQSTSGSNHFHQAFNNKGNMLNWSPQPTSISNPAYDYINDYRQRPKSAEPPLTHSHYQLSNLSISNLKSQMPSNQNGSNPSKSTNLKKTTELNIDTQSANNNNANSNTNESPGSTVNTPTNANSGNTSATSSSNSSMNPKSLTDPKLLNNIPIWLKTLRLHKYSDILSDLRWEKLIYLEDDDLLNRGVMALGARRKLLKAFNIVKDYKERNLIDSSAYLDSR